MLFDEFVACFLRCLAFGFGGLIWSLDLVVSAHGGGLLGVWVEKKQAYRLGVYPRRSLAGVVGREKASLLVVRLPMKLFLSLKGKKKVVELKKCSNHKPYIRGVW